VGYNRHSARSPRATVGDSPPRRILLNRSSIATHSSTGQRDSAAATVCRRVFAEVSVLAVRWPLMCSTRLSSSMTALATQERHSVRIVSAGGRPNAARPFVVSCNRLPASSASPPAWISSGHANAAIGSVG
jgi:hypothetical protein